jgi:hypothetical protein
MLERDLHLGLLQMLLVYWIVRSESHCARFSLRDVFIITIAGAAAVYRMQRLSKPREQHLYPHHIGQSEVHQKALAASFLWALAIALYPSTTFAVHRTSSSQSAHCRNRRGIQKSRSWQL